MIGRHNERARVNESLRPRRRSAADLADGINFVTNSARARVRACSERLTPETLVGGNYHPHAFVTNPRKHGLLRPQRTSWQSHREGLPAMFVNFAGVGDVYGFDSSVVMGDDLALPVPIIDHRFENQDPLLCKVNPPDPPQKFFRFAREHAPGYHFNPSVLYL